LGSRLPAAELDEPGAMAALIGLKLSRNAQFHDRPGACKLIETAVSRGDQTMTLRLGNAAPTDRGAAPSGPFGSH
jgi:hypothetical protein